MHQETRFPNGARLLTEEVPGARSAAFGFFIGAGSRQESPADSGSAHFVEHMLFKGTDRRTASDLARDSDALGGQFNAYTTKELTCFYGRTLDRHLDRGLDILEDMLFHSRFDQKDIETERGVILEEISMYEDTPDDLVCERLYSACYKGTPLARPILGTPASLEKVTGPGLAAWQREHYVPSAITAALAGSFTAAQRDRLASLLAGLEGGPAPEGAPASYRPAVTSKRKALEQNHLVLACPALSYLDSRRPQLLLLSSMLGGGCSSRLFQKVREELGLCYTVYTYLDDHQDTGLMGIYAAVSPEQEPSALDNIRRVVSEFAEHGPDEEELDRAREQAKAGLLMASESVQARMSHLGSSALLYGRVRELPELLELYDSVTREEVRTLAEELFRPELASLSAVGRVSAAGAYAKWLGR